MVQNKKSFSVTPLCTCTYNFAFVLYLATQDNSLSFCSTLSKKIELYIWQNYDLPILCPTEILFFQWHFIICTCRYNFAFVFYLAQKVTQMIDICDACAPRYLPMCILIMCGVTFASDVCWCAYSYMELLWTMA
jgi:hypothetical protein